MGDPVRLQQILTNLLGNAVKFTKQGEVTLKVELIKVDRLALIQFAVIDTGMGIEKRKIEKIFDPFIQEDSTVRRRFGGTGLGLSISRDLVSLLGGTLAVESQKNVGSRFYFSLSFTVIENHSVAEQVAQLSLGSYSTVIVEPNMSISNSLAALINQTGGSSVRIQTPKELQEMISGELLPSDSRRIEQREIMIFDYEFSKGLLPSLYSKIRKGNLKAESLIFIIKTTASSSDIEELAEYGIKNFLFKPVKPLQLIEAIAQGLSVTKSLQTGEITDQETSPAYDQRPLRILVVDDSKDNQFLVKAFLSSLPYRLAFADNGRIAVEKFKLAQFDIVLMDLQMPEMDGYAATELIREWEFSENFYPTPIIAVSAHDHESSSDRFRKSKFSHYLMKPVSPHQLRQTIVNFTGRITVPMADPALEIEKQIAALGPEYLKSRTQELETLKTLLEQANFERIETLGHRLKGNAKSYGFEELGEIGKKLEEAARTHDAYSINSLIQETEIYLTSNIQGEIV